MRAHIFAALAVVALAMPAQPAAAEVNELRIGKQYGLPYIQLVIMEDQKLIEKHARQAGLGDVAVNWVTVSGPAALNDGIISGELHVAAVGLPNLVTMWDKTRSNVRVRAISGMNAMPLILLTRNAAIKSLKDFTDKDRVAVPSVKISMQAILLEIAAAKAFGNDAWEKLDPLTVSMGHPDAVAALVTGGNEVTTHFSSLPFSYRQLKQPGIHAVLSSFDIIGPHSVSSLVTTTKFHDDNPKTTKVFLDALKEATAFINANKQAAAEIYLRVTKDRTPLDEFVAMLSDPSVKITVEPMGVEPIAAFMQKVGRVKATPDNWKDYYFGDLDLTKTN